jgi:hypothetical protein
MSAPEYTPSSMVVQFQIEPGGHDSEEFLTHTSEEIVVLLQGEIPAIGFCVMTPMWMN